MSPPALDRVVKKCLAKDPEDRWQNAADLGSELKWIGESGSQAGVPAPIALRRRVRLGATGTIAGVILGALVGGLGVRWWLSREPAREAPKPAWLSMLLPSDAPLASYGAQTLAFSPDGTRLVYAAEHGGTTQLYLRSLDRLDAMPVRDSEGAMSAFFSPDSRWLGFFAGTRLMKVPVEGGVPQTHLRSRRGPRGELGLGRHHRLFLGHLRIAARLRLGRDISNAPAPDAKHGEVPSTGRKSCRETRRFSSRLARRGAGLRLLPRRPASARDLIEGTERAIPPRAISSLRAAGRSSPRPSMSGAWS